MKVSSFYKPFVRPFTKSSSSKSRAGKPSVNVASQYDLSSRQAASDTAVRAAVAASALHAGLAVPEYVTAKSTSRASKPAEAKSTGTHYVNATTRQAGSVGSAQAAMNATLAAHFRQTAAMDSLTAHAAQQAASPRSMTAKLKAVFAAIATKIGF